jgi:hypothetical protein
MLMSFRQHCAKNLSDDVLIISLVTISTNSGNKGFDTSGYHLRRYLDCFALVHGYNSTMAKRKQMTAAEQAAEIAKLDLRPPREANRRTTGLLRAMLSSPPDPHVKKPAKRAKK